MTFRQLIIVFALLCGGVAHAAEPSDAPASPIDSVARALKRLPDGVQNVLQYALSQAGVAYRPGGNSPDSGFDCSGFVRYVFGQVAGVALPHSSQALSLIGSHIKVADLRPGDLVFFHAVRNTVSHVGIYLGDNRFIHASSTQSGSVMISDLTESYWVKHFTAARRLDLPAEKSSSGPD